MPRVVWRRSATAVGVYSATAFGVLGTIVATRELGTSDYALFASVFAATAFVQLLLDLTVEEALVKYGFRYSERGDWPRFRRLFEVALAFKLVGGALGVVALVALAPFSTGSSGGDAARAPAGRRGAAPARAGAGGRGGAARSSCAAATTSAPRSLPASMLLRLAGIAVGSRYGVTRRDGRRRARAGRWRRPRSASAARSRSAGSRAHGSAPLGDDRRDFRRFVVSVERRVRALVSAAQRRSAPHCSARSRRSIRPATSASRRRRQPASGALSAPARLVLLTEQTRDCERGRHDRVYAMLRRYMLGTALLDGRRRAARSGG